MKMEDFIAYTKRCFNGEAASCSFACPFHLDIRSFLEKAEKGRWTAAYKELANAVVFPVIVSALCGQPCRERCPRSVTKDEAIALSDIEKAVIKYAKNRKPEAYFIPPKTKSIAVVGASVSGLSCALNLAQKKYPVTVFDRNGGWGGKKTVFSYLGHTFSHEVPTCPKCGKIFISKELAEGRMAEIEELLEDK